MDWNFNKHFTEADLLADEDLQEELRQLGWEDGHSHTPASAKPTKAAPQTKPKPQTKEPAPKAQRTAPDPAALALLQQQFVMPDINSIGDIDDADIPFDESDMNDSNLFSELQALGWEEHEQSDFKTHDNDIEPDLVSFETPGVDGDESVKAEAMGMAQEAQGEIDPQEVEEYHLPSQQEVDQRVLSLKRQALAAKKAGNKSDAIQLLRQAKMLEEGVGDAEQQVEHVRNIAQRETVERPKMMASANSQREPSFKSMYSDESVSSLRSSVYAKTEDVRGSGVSIAEAKARAIACKKAGDKQGALEWLRMAKQMEADSKQTPTHTDPGIGIPPPMPLTATRQSVSDIFSPLESALNEAQQAALAQAKNSKASGDNKVAVDKFKEYKNWQQELQVLQSRRMLPGAQPALFEWRTTTRNIRIQNTDIGSEEVRVHIDEIDGLAGPLSSHKARTIIVNFNLGFPRDTPTTGSARAQADDATWKANIDHSLSVAMKRARATQQLFSRKKATFDVVLQRGFFKSEIAIGKATLPLTELNTKCEVGGYLPIVDGRKATGARIKVRLRVRDPFETPEVLTQQDRVLVIGQWPAVPSNPTSNPTVTPASQTNSQNHAPHAAVAHEAHPQQEPQQRKVEEKPETEVRMAQQEPRGAEFATLSDREKADPTGVELLVSNDVLDDELTLARKRLQSMPRDSETRYQEELRIQLLQTKLDMLVLRVQREEITLPQYIELVQQRLQRDSLLARYLQVAGRRQEAVGVVRRVQIMQQEIANASSAEEG